MEEQKHVPRTIMSGIDANGRYDFGICGCGLVAKISEWRREYTGNRFTVEWEQAEPWRSPTEGEGGGVKVADVYYHSP